MVIMCKFFIVVYELFIVGILKRITMLYNQSELYIIRVYLVTSDVVPRYLEGLWSLWWFVGETRLPAYQSKELASIYIMNRSHLRLIQYQQTLAHDKEPGIHINTNAIFLHMKNLLSV